MKNDFKNWIKFLILKCNQDNSHYYGHVCLHFLFLISSTLFTGWVGCPLPYVTMVFLFHGTFFTFFLLSSSRIKKRINFFMLILFVFYILFMIIIAFIV